jgi:hypothetical protein
MSVAAESWHADLPERQTKFNNRKIEGISWARSASGFTARIEVPSTNSMQRRLAAKIV